LLFGVYKKILATFVLDVSSSVLPSKCNSLNEQYTALQIKLAVIHLLYVSSNVPIHTSHCIYS
jgi:hypothetical protein